jgi:hypothetical protein
VLDKLLHIFCNSFILNFNTISLLLSPSSSNTSLSCPFFSSLLIFYSSSSISILRPQISDKSSCSSWSSINTFYCPVSIFIYYLFIKIFNKNYIQYHFTIFCYLILTLAKACFAFICIWLFYFFFKYLSFFLDFVLEWLNYFGSVFLLKLWVFYYIFCSFVQSLIVFLVKMETMSCSISEKYVSLEVNHNLLKKNCIRSVIKLWSL